MRGAGLTLVGSAASAVFALCALSGCGATAGGASSLNALRLQREDLVAITRALKSAEPSVGVEVAAARSGWAVVADGLPSSIPSGDLPAVRTAEQKANQVAAPPLFGEERARVLTGPGAALAGQFHTYTELAIRGWTMIAAAIEGIQHGAPATARFYRANVALYIDSVYDGHFGLAEIGKNLLAAYRQLGGTSAFAGALTDAEVDAVAGAYSPASARLEPHPGVALGS